MKTERMTNKLKRNGLIAAATVAAILAVMAFAAPQSAMAGTLTVPAPKETASIHLGVKDPPASAKLDGWWCSKTDKVREDVGELYRGVWQPLHFGQSEVYDESGGFRTDIRGTAGGEGAIMNMSDWKTSHLDKGWPFKLAGLQKSPTKTGLDAPPGGTKVYKFKYCYTSNELKTIHDKVVAWMKYIDAHMVNILKSKEKQLQGLDGELAGFIAAGH